MKQLGKWMLGAAMVAGTMGLGSTAANAAQVRVGVYVGGGPAAYVPPCPGQGYQWVTGYYSGGYWVPGRWSFVGTRYYGNGGYSAYYHDHDAYQDRGRDWDRDRDRDHDRGEHRGWDHNRR